MNWNELDAVADVAEQRHLLKFAQPAVLALARFCILYGGVI
jgi:hypothetical protein